MQVNLASNIMSYCKGLVIKSHFLTGYLISKLHLHFGLLFSPQGQLLNELCTKKFLFQGSFVKWKNTWLGYFFHCRSPLSLSWGTPVSRKQFVNKCSISFVGVCQRTFKILCSFHLIYFPKLLSKGKILIGEWGRRSSHLQWVNAFLAI